MKDSYGRKINYLRISITDRCNLRCRYCMPEDIDTVPMGQILSYEEIAEVSRCAAKLGISKIRITGGEPLIRRDVCDLIRMLKAIPGIDTVALTTNGVLLEQMVPGLAEAGVDGINVSLDTLDRKRYELITGKDELDSVLKGIEAAERIGIPLKINAVSLDPGRYFGLSSQGEDARLPGDFSDIIGLAQYRPVDVRFIELMPIGYGKDCPGIGHDRLIGMVRDAYPGLEKEEVQGAGPAVYYRIPGYRGRVGFISAIHGRFCDSCNRIRLTSMGFLKSCLCYDTGVDIKDLLRSDMAHEQKAKALLEGIRQCILQKPAAHVFSGEGEITEKKAMSAIGG